MSGTKTYSRRLFLTYDAVMAGRASSVESVVEAFAKANKDVDLEQRLTFAQWEAELARPRRAVRAVN